MVKITEFQKENHLVPDGIIGVKTLSKLGDHIGIYGVELANFMGQLHHETGGFKYDTETMNYSASRLKVIFSYYKNNPQEADKDGRTIFHKADQETIANKVYWDQNRSRSHWLGNKDWGDGWNFRGRGAIQTTGRWNYSELENFVGDDLMNNPSLVATKYYWESALYFFNAHKLWKYAQDTTIKSITELTGKINGGLNGLDERVRLTRYYNYLLNK